MPLYLSLILVFLPALAAAQGQMHGKDGPGGNAVSNVPGQSAPADDRIKRREELRAALKAQGDEAPPAAARGISPQERAALREQLRLQAGHSGVQQ